MANIGSGTSRVIIDPDGEAATVTNNKLDVNATLVAGATIDIGDVDMFLDGGTAVLGGAGAVAAGVLRVTLASDDPAVVSLDEIESAIEAIEGAVDGSYLNVNMNLAGSDAQAGEGTITATTQRVTIATDDDGVAHLATIAGDTTSIQTAVELLDNAISGAGFNITQLGSAAVPIGAGTEAAALRVTIANNSTGLISIDDGGGVITVDGTVTANLSSTDNTVLDNILTKNTEIDAVLDTIKVDTEAIETAVELLDNAIDGSEMQVDIVSSATLTVDGSGVTQPISGTITANLSATDNAVLDAIAASLEILDDWDDSNYANVNINIAGTDVDGNSGNKSAQSQRVVIATDDIPIALVNTKLDHLSDNLDTLETTNNAMEVLLGTIDADTNAIKNAVEILDDWDDSNYANVNINLAGSDAPTGGGAESGALRVTIANDSTGVLTVDGTVTANLGSTDNAVLDAIDAVLDTIKVDTEAIETAVEAIQVDADAIETLLTAANVDHAANEALLITIDADTNAIKTAVEIIDNAIDGSEMQVDIVSSATITVDGTVTANLSSTDNAVLDAMVVDLAAIEVDLAALEVLSTAANVDHAANEALLTTIDSDTNAIKNAVETIDNAISGSEMQVDVVAALPAGSNAIGKLAPNSGVDIGDVDVTSTVHPAGNGTFNSYAQFAAATSPTALTDATNGVNSTETAAKEVIIQAD